ncbi:helix-turn-helix domain-containing protein [Nocardia sp. NPDC004654]|uniref:TetR/AcrR family transcriptional regulator n=1 Tax=Nocardia sp. NPDC004654 TaxID=3154776 RepID=UPI0033AB9072
MEKRRTQAERRAASRRRLIDAAIELLATRGYARTSLAAIGEKAGVSRGLITHHFGSKEQCIAEVVAHIRRLVEAELHENERRGLAAIENLLRVYLQESWQHSYSARAMYVILVEALTAESELLGAVAENNAAIRAMICTWIGEAVDLGEVSPQIDAQGMAVVIEGILRGVLLQILVDPDKVDREAAITASINMARAALVANA